MFPPDPRTRGSQMRRHSHMAYSFTEKKRIRKDFGKQRSILEVPFPALTFDDLEGRSDYRRLLERLVSGRLDAA